MSISIRRAGINDTEAVMKLLSEVLELHAALRPDIFISGSTKYTAKELGTIFEDDGRPVLSQRMRTEIFSGMPSVSCKDSLFNQYEGFYHTLCR